MASFRYFIKGKGNPSKIYVRFTNGKGGGDYTRSIGLYINPEFWSAKQGKVRQKAEYADKGNMQEKLDGLQSFLYSQYTLDQGKGIRFTGVWLQEQIDLHFEREKETDLNQLREYAQHYADNLHNKVQPNGKVGVTKGTLKKYHSVVTKIIEFESHKKKRYRIDDVNMTFHRDVIKFFHDLQGLNYKTTGKYIKFIKTICKDAERHGISVHADLNKPEFRPTDEKTVFITFTEDEIERIRKHDFKHADYLDNARNWLLIGVWTGARAGDLLKLTMSNVHDDYIEYTAEKTEQKIAVHLHDHIMEIIERTGRFPRPISQQRLNDYIKEVCKLVGLTEIVSGAKNNPKTRRKEKGRFPKWELVTTHAFRRTFATYYYGKIPTPALMAMTGHKTEQMLLNYIGKTARDSADVLRDYWMNQKREKGKHLHAVKTAG